MKPKTLVSNLAGIATFAKATNISHGLRHWKSVRQDQQNDAGSGWGGPKPADAAKTAIDAMNSAFYSPPDGRWSAGEAWWISGNALQVLLDYMWHTGSRDYMGQALQVFDAQRGPVPWWPQGGGDFRADSTDDTAWWALAMARLFDLTGDKTYLDISVLDEAYMTRYWTDDVCAGGLYVDIKALTYKNAVANELYMLLLASLHNRISGDTVYLDKAIKTWNWLKGSRMINGDGLFNDGLAGRDDKTCFNNKLPVWTYNQGIVLGGLTELYRATSDKSYLTSARQIADTALSTKHPLPLVNKDGILIESGCDSGADASCNGDQQVFKGIFARFLAELDSALDGDGHPYRPFLLKNAQRAYDNARDPKSSLYDVSWTGPYGSSDLAKQASAASLWVALI